jgi:sugar phosphate isomerase/epimerase
MTSRRTFLTQAGLLSTGMIIKPGFVSVTRKNNTVGLQLYSLRDQLSKDVTTVINKVAAAGYKTVETWQYNKAGGFFGLDAKAFKNLLNDNGLTIPSGHFLMDMYLSSGKTNDLHDYIEAANTLGMEYLIIGYINSDFIKTADDFKRVAEKFNGIARICGQSGLKMGYHNHNFEWKEAGGTTFYDTLLSETDPALVHMEMDIYWVVRAGMDPVAIIKAHPGRFFAFHIKDMDKTHAELNTEIGKGSIDFKSILNYSKLAGIKYYIVEQENYINIDPYISITESCAYVKNVLHV